MHKSFLLPVLACTVGLFSLLGSCKNDPLEVLPAGNGATTSNECDPDSVYFSNTIGPLLATNCSMSGCHDNSANAPDGIRLTSYSNLMNSGIVQPGNPGNSELMEVVTETDPDKIMPPPPAAPLSPSQIAMLNQWITQGSRNNSCASCDTNNVTYSGAVVPLLQSKCNGCHGNSNPGGGVVLSSYNGVQTVALNGKLLSSVEHTSSYPMPKNQPKLSECEIGIIRIWVDQGAPNN